MRCGTGVRDITPRGPIHLMGYAARWGTPTRGGVHDPLYAKALYLEQGDTRLLLLSVDLCELLLPDAQAICRRITEATGVSHVVLAATHTHSAPNTCAQPCGGAFDAAWFGAACNAMVDAARDAAGEPFEALVGVGQGALTGFGKNRRHAGGCTDPALTVMKVTDTNGTLRALHINFACHCTILDGNNYAISADYPGFAYAALAETHPEAVVLFTNGAAGDINIGYSSDASALGERMAFRSFETAKAYGQRLAGAVLRIARQTQMGRPPLSATAFDVAYPLRPDMPALSAIAADIQIEARRMAQAMAEDEARAAHIRRIYLECLGKMRETVGDAQTLMAPSYLLRLGEAAYVTTQTELFCEIGLRLKAALPGAGPHAVIGYAGGYIGYLPTADAIRAGGYEAETSPFGLETADALLAAVRAASG